MKTKTVTPRIGNHYGMLMQPVRVGLTWIEDETFCTDYGQFKRRGLVRYAKSRVHVPVRLDIADTWFSIPATTSKEHGFVTSEEDAEGARHFVFVPHTDQTKTPAQFRKEVRLAYK